MALHEVHSEKPKAKVGPMTGIEICIFLSLTPEHYRPHIVQILALSHTITSHTITITITSHTITILALPVLACFKNVSNGGHFHLNTAMSLLL